MLDPTDGTVIMSTETFNSLQEDANRYRYLRTQAQGKSLHMDGTSYWVISAQAIRYRGRSVDEAIDRHLNELLQCPTAPAPR